MATTLTIKDKNGTEYVLVPGKSLELSDITMDGGGNITFDGPSELPAEVDYGVSGNFKIRAGASHFEYTINGSDWYQLDGELSRDNGTGGNARIYYNTTSEKWMVDNDDGGAAFEIGSGGGSGDMTKAVYDTTANDIVDKAEQLDDTTNVVTAAQARTHLDDTATHFSEASIDHTNITNKGTNTHTQIDTHLGDDTKHRVINDSGTTTTELFSADKINTALGTKSDSSHSHSNALHDDVAGEITSLTEKGTPISTDVLIIEDSAAANVKKKVQITNLPGGSGTDDDAIHDNVAAEISSISAKASPVAADYFLIEDSEDSNNKKYIQYSQLPAGGADAAAIHVDQTGEISGLTEKASPIGADVLVIEDSVASYGKKKVQITNLPGGADADAIHDNVAGEIIAVTEKASPIAADVVLIEDTEDSNNKKRVQVGNLPGGGSGDMTKAVYDTTANDIVDKAEQLDDTTNTVTAAQARTHLDDTTNHFSEASIDHTNITNKGTTTHADIDTHVGDDTKHRVINDSGTLTTELFSADKINTALGTKSDTTHAHDNSIHDDVSSEISAITEKASPVSADLILIEDSEATNAKKRVQVGNLPGGSGTDNDAIHDNVAAEITAVTEKASPVGADVLLIEDSEDSSNKKKVQITNLPGGADSDAIHDNVAAEISIVTEKASPVDADLLLIEDSADSNNKKRIQVGNLPFLDVTEKGASDGVAELDSGGKVPEAQLPASALQSGGGGTSTEFNGVASVLALAGQDISPPAQEYRGLLYTKAVPGKTPDSYTKLLIESNTTNGDTSFEDVGSTGHTPTGFGSIAHSTAQKVFGTSSLDFDGGTKYLSFPNHADFDLADHDFTIDFWIRWRADITSTVIADKNWDTTPTYLLFVPGTTAFEFYYSTDGVATSTLNWPLGESLVLDTWYHFALARNGSTIQFYLNGEGKDEKVFTDTVWTSTTKFTLGAENDDAGTSHDGLDGWIDEFRISKGIARWTADFIPDTVPYTYQVTDLAYKNESGTEISLLAQQAYDNSQSLVNQLLSDSQSTEAVTKEYPTGWVDTLVDTDIVDAGESSGYVHLDPGIGLRIGGTVESHTISADETADLTQEYNWRDIIPASELSIDGEIITVTIRSGQNAGYTFNNMYIGHQASSGDVWDFDGTQVRVTWNTGSNGATLAQDTTLTSDQITYSLDSTKNLIVAFNTGNTAGRHARDMTTATGFALYYKQTASDETGTTSPDSYSISDNRIDLVQSIDAIGADSYTVVTTQHTRSSAPSKGIPYVHYYPNEVITLDTDVNVYQSADDGVTWEEITPLENHSALSDGSYVLLPTQAFVASNTTTRLKVVSSKDVDILGIGHLFDVEHYQPTAEFIQTPESLSDYLLTQERLGEANDLPRQEGHYGWTDSYATALAIDDGASSNYEHDPVDDTISNISPTETASYTLTTQSGSALGTYTERLLLVPADISTSGTRIRLQLKTSNAGVLQDIDSAWFGEQASSGNAYDFDGNQVQVTFNDGNTSYQNIPLSTTFWTDWLDFTIDEANTYLFTWDWAKTGWSMMSNATSNRLYYQADVQKAGETTPSGTWLQGSHFFVSAIEVGAANATSEIITFPFETTPEPSTGSFLLHYTPVDTVTIGVDLRIYQSLDNGSTWEEFTSPTVLKTLSDGSKILYKTQAFTTSGDQTTKLRLVGTNTKGYYIHSLSHLFDIDTSAPQGGASLTVTDTTTTVENVDNITFNGGIVSDLGSGDVSVLLGELTQTFVETVATDAEPITARNYRQLISASDLSEDGTKVQLTFEASSGYGLQLDPVYIGYQASSGNAWDFDGTPTQVTFDNGNSQGVVTAGQELVSDIVNFAFDATQDVIISVYFDTGVNSGVLVDNTSTSTLYWKDNVDGTETDDLTPSGYTTANTTGLVKTIDVFQASAGSPLTVTDDTTTVNNVTTIRTNPSSGFTVDDDTGGQVTINLGSSWNPISVTGQTDLDATGEEELEIEAGTNITLTTNTGTTPKKLTINADVESIDLTKDANTLFLLHSDTTNGSTDVSDESSDNHSITLSGGMSHSTTQKKFGATSLYFEGTDDYLTVTDNAAWDLSGDFTIEFWMYKDGTQTANGTIFSWNIAGDTDWTSTNALVLFTPDQTTLTLMENPGLVGCSATGVANDTWHHIAIVRSGTTVSLYVNGTEADTITGYSSTLGSEAGWGFGKIDIRDLQYFKGYIDEARVSDIARYTTTFTPDTVPFKVYAVDQHTDDDTLHRIINDSGTSSTELWSASKINTELGSVTGGLNYIGTWDADTNSPDVPASSPSNGDYYKVSVAGSTSLGGITDWDIADWAIYSGTEWQKIDNSEVVNNLNINGLTEKSSPVSADILVIEDTENSNNLKKVQLSNISGSVDIGALSAKTSYHDDDVFILEDAEDANAQKKIVGANILKYRDPIPNTDVYDPSASWSNALWNGDSHRFVLTSGQLLASGSSVRVYFRAHTTDALYIDQAYIGVRSTGSTFDGNQVQVTFEGGNSAVVVPLNSDVASDPISFTISGSVDIMVAYDMKASTSSGTQMSSTAGVGYSYYKTGNNTLESHLNSVSGYTGIDNRSYAIPKIEIYGGYTTVSVIDRTDAAIHDDVSGEIAAITEKASPVSADLLVIEDSEATNAKKRVQIGNLPGGSGTDDDAIHDNVSGEIVAVTEKASPVDADVLLIEDSAATNAKKRVQVGNLPFIDVTEKGANSGVAELDATGKVPVAQIPGTGGFAGTLDAPLSLQQQNSAPAASSSYGKVYATGTGDPIDSYTSLLIHSDTTNGSTTFTDSGPTGHTITPLGGTAHNTTQSKFGASSIYFDGSDDHLSLDNHDDWDLAGNDWTIEAWVYFSTAPNEVVLFDRNYDEAKQYQLYWTSNTSVTMYTSYDGVNLSNISWTVTAMVADTWYHIAVERYGDTMDLYINGTGQNSQAFTTDIYDGNTKLSIGAQSDDANTTQSWVLHGYVDEFRLTNGLARYQGNFSVETTPFGDALVTDIKFKNGSGTELSLIGDASAIHDDVAAEINALTEKGTPVSADLLLIEDSADSNNKKKVQVGNLPGGAGSFSLLAQDSDLDTEIFSHTMTTDSGGWYDWSVRQLIPAASLSASLSHVVLTFEAGSTEGVDIATVYIGHQASSGNAWDFDGNQVEVTFGGTSGVTIGAGLTSESDQIEFALDSAQDLIITYDFNNNQSADELVRGTLYADTNFGLYYKQVTDEASVTAPTGYSEYADTMATIVDISGASIEDIDGYTFVEGTNIDFSIDTVNDELTIASLLESRLTYRVAGGPLVTTTNADGAKITNRTGTIQAIYITCDDTGTTGSALTIDVLKNGTSIYTGGGTKPTIAANTGTFQYNISTDPNDTGVLATDLFVVEIESVPDDAAGLTCEIIIQ